MSNETHALRSDDPPARRERRGMTPERALAHPLRASLVAALTERTASPAELAAALNERLGTVAYHVRALEGAGLVELVDRSVKRGAVQHHYRARALDIVAERLALPADRASSLAAKVRALVDAER